LQGDGDRVCARHRQAGEYAGAALAGEGQRHADVGLADRCGGNDDRVRHHAAGQLPHQLDGLERGRGGVRRPESRRGCSFELARVDRDYAGRAADARALNGGGADPARADHHHRVTAAHAGAVGRRAVSGRHRARQQRRGDQRDIGVDLDE